MKNNFIKILLASLAISLLLSLLFLFGFFSSWRAKLTDKLFIAGARDESILIVAIDNKSLQEIGRWPWDRKVFAQLIEKITQAGPAVIGLDVNFPERSNADSDKQLGQAIKGSGNVVMPIEADLAYKNRIQAKNLLSSIGDISDASLGEGITNTPPDQDGIFRKLPIKIFAEDGTPLRSFSEIIANKYFSLKNSKTQDILVDSKGYMTINYAGKPKSFAIISAIDVLNGKIKNEDIKDKIILIGATAPDLHDEQMVPTSGRSPMSGVEIHANAINTIIANNFIKNLNKYWQALIFIIIALLLGLLLSYAKLRNGSLIAFAIIITYILAAAILIDHGIIVDIFYFLLTVILTFITAVSFKYVFASKEKKFIKETFNRYVSEDIINELIRHPEKIKLGGDKKELSILFSDIRGFTSISEKLDPEKMVSLLNRYLTSMSDIIMSNHGVIDKYIGDAIMAFWGAPVESDHAELSCRSAISMMKELESKRNEWQKEFGVEINIGIGINTGEVVIGNMGSDKRFDYTVMGDHVNLSSRLEGLTKMYGVPIIVSEYVKNKAGEKYVFRFLDKVAVKGKSEGVKIFELICAQSDLTEATSKKIKSFHKAAEYYFKQEWEKANLAFCNFISQYGNDIAAKLYIERCQKYSANPPGVDWDGVCRLINK